MRYDDDAPDVVEFPTRTAKAAKAYRCDECPLGGPPDSAVIPVGHAYRRKTGTIDGEFFTSRKCASPCPHAVGCPACNGRGWSHVVGSYYDSCPRCDGSGKVRP